MEVLFSISGEILSKAMFISINSSILLGEVWCCNDCIELKKPKFNTLKSGLFDDSDFICIFYPLQNPSSNSNGSSFRWFCVTLLNKYIAIFFLLAIFCELLAISFQKIFRISVLIIDSMSFVISIPFFWFLLLCWDICVTMAICQFFHQKGTFCVDPI